MNTIQAIEYAMDGGYKMPRQIESKRIIHLNSRVFGQATAYKMFQAYVFLDPLFWECLGRRLGWVGDDMYLTTAMPASKAYWHRFIDHLDEKKEPELFFEML